MVEIRDRVDGCVIKFRWIGVHETHPAATEFTRDTVDRFEKTWQAAVVADVHAVTRRVLSDEVQLKRARCHEATRFGRDLIERFRTHFPANRWNRAKRAALVASFRDTQVRPVTRREAHAIFITFEVTDALAVGAIHGQTNGFHAALRSRLQCVPCDPILRRFFRDFRRAFTADRIDDVIAIKDADHRIDAGGPLEQLRAVPLHQTTGDHHALDLTFLFAANRVVNHFERLVFRCFEEAAGVDDDRVGALIFVDEFEA